MLVATTIHTCCKLPQKHYRLLQCLSIRYLRRSNYHVLTCLENHRHDYVLHSVHHRRYKSDSLYLAPDIKPVHWVTDCLTTIHDVTGLPWWAAIGLTTISQQTLISFPAHLFSQRVIAKVEKLKPEIEALARQENKKVLHEARKHGWNESYSKRVYTNRMKGLLSELYIRDNCHPLKASIVDMLARFSLWFTMTSSLRHMCAQGTQPELATQGLLWFSDLTASDTTLIMPILFGCITLIRSELNMLQAAETIRHMKYIVIFIRVLTLVIVLLAAWMPSAVSWYWLCFTSISMSHYILLLYPGIRRLCRIPKTPSELDRPLTDLFAKAKKRYTKPRKYM